jgi:hypothetical protein
MIARHSRWMLLEQLQETARLLRARRHGQAYAEAVPADDLACDETSSIRQAVLGHLNRLMVRIWGGMADAADFRRARANLAALPLATAEFAVALARLNNARTYLQEDEPGAATYELRLLARSLRLR